MGGSKVRERAPCAGGAPEARSGPWPQEMAGTSPAMNARCAAGSRAWRFAQSRN